MPELTKKAAIRVRMYRVGFGDCFLLTIPSAPPRHVLVDCGVHFRGDVKTLGEVVANVEEETNGELAVVIASHAHQDHISGFLRHADVFERMQIGEVWLPWSEDPSDKVAISHRRREARLVAALQAHAAVRPLSAAANAALGNLAFSQNRSTLDLLRSGFGSDAQVRFLEGGKALQDIGGVRGFNARILGPPKDEAFLRKMDPPKPQRFLRAGPDGEVLDSNAIVPFASRWVRPEGDTGPPRLQDKDEDDLKDAGELPADALAFTLEQARNNTSLMVLFSYRGRQLLFPGDAQWGAWKSVLELPDSEEVLASVDFYKVSHHGSENATPPAALERMPTDRLAAMVSTQSEPWPSIPYGKLVDALDERTGSRWVRSDCVPVPGLPSPPAAAEPPEAFRVGRLWVDYFLKTGALSTSQVAQE